MIKGVVIGKFYPPHKGHNYLIETALSQSDELTVIVCQQPGQIPSGALRAEWIKQLHPKAKVLLVEDHYDQDDSKLWAELTIEWLGFKPDVVFTSENYGEPYAHFMNCRHVLVDLDRSTFSISGTKVRENPYKHWEMLHPIVRQFYLKRICIVGAESTGTTTLAQHLAEQYKTCWVPEYGRTYWEGKMHTPNANQWKTDEFTHIASQQNQMEDALALEANRILICDTNSWATSVWHERYVGHESGEVINQSQNRKYDLYIVTDTDIPFVQDGTRDGEHIRKWMHERFISLLEQNNQKYMIVSGSKEQRLAKAVQEIDLLFKNLYGSQEV